MQQCVQKIKANMSTTTCLHNCEGVLITSYIKTVTTSKEKSLLRYIDDQYRRYKGYIDYPDGLTSKCDLIYYIQIRKLFFLISCFYIPTIKLKN